jgi:hypothetical protein
MTWKDVSPEDAARHRLYGFSGWLVIYYALGVATFLVWFGFGVYSFAKGVDTRSMHGMVMTTLASIALLQALFIVPFLVMAPMRHYAMPSVVTVCLWFGVAVNLLHAPLIGAASHIVWAAIITVYLLRSKRVNVTYLHRVPA